MSTAGTLVINLALNSIGVTAGLASVKAQVDAFQTQVNGQNRAQQAQAAAQRVAQAQDVVALATDRVNLAQMRAASSGITVTEAQARLAAVTADATVADNVKAAAATRLRNAELSLATAQNQVRAATIGLKDAQIGLTVAQRLAANPPVVKNGFPLITAAASLAGLAVLKFGEDAVAAAGRFQYQMRLVQTQAGASSREVARMSEAILSLAPTVQAGPEELARGLFHVESVGYQGAKALDILKTAAQGAAVGNADLESVTNALVAAVATGIKGTENFSQAMGVLNATVGTGNLRMQDLAASLSSGVLATAKQFGLGLEDVGAALATMADQGIPAEEGATRLRITIALLGAPTKLAAEQLSKIGLSQRDLAEAMRGPDGLLGTLVLLKKHLDDTFGSDEVAKTQILKSAFGGSRSSSGILTMINSLELFGNKVSAISKGKDSFAERFAEESSTFEAAARNLGAAVDVLKVRIGNGILGPVTLLANVLGVLASQTLLMVPLFTALTAVITIWATVSTIKLLASITQTVVGWGIQLAAGLTLRNVFEGMTFDTSLLATAQANLANTLRLTTPAILGETAAMAQNAEATAATMAAITESVPAIISVGEAAMAAGVEVDGMTASLEGNLIVMRQMAATTPVLVAGLAGADGAIAATTASTGALIIGTQTATGAEEVFAASTGPVITGLEAQAVASAEAAAAMQALALAQTEVAVQQGLVGGGILAGITGAFTAGGVMAGIASIGKLIGSTIAKAIPIAIAAGLGLGLGTAIYNFLWPQVSKQAEELVANTKKFVEGANMEQLKNAKAAYESAIAQSHGGGGPEGGIPIISNISDFFNWEHLNELKTGLETVDAKIEDELAHAGYQSGVGFSDGLATGLAGVTTVNQSLIQQFGETMVAVQNAAAELGGAAMGEYAKSLNDARQAPADAFQSLVTALKDQMTPAQEIARGVGILASQALAEGLTSGDQNAVAAAEALRKQTTERLDKLTGNAYSAGTRAGYTWQEAFLDSLTSGGLDPATAAAKLADILADPTKVAAAEQKFQALKDTWKTLSPTARDAATAVGQLYASLDSTSVADQAAKLVKDLGDNIVGLKNIGETAGSELMGAVAKGIKDQRDAPLNALKELHNAMQDQFSKNREIALLWAELQSKDIADGLASQDPYIVAKTQETIDLVTTQLDYLTGGAYSRSLGAGAGIGQGLSDSKPLVTAGAADAVSGVGPILDATGQAAWAGGSAAAQNIGNSFAASSDVVTAGAAVAMQGVGAIFDAVVAGADASGQHAAAGAARGLASQAGVVLDGASKMLEPALKWLSSLGEMFGQLGKMFGINFGTNLSQGASIAAQGSGAAGGKVLGDAAAAAIKAAQSTKSFGDYLKDALKGSGDMAKYLNDALNGVTNTAASAKAAITTAFADIKASAEQYFQTIHEKNLQAIQDAHDQKNAILDAKEALNQKPVTAAQKALDFQRQAQQEWRLRKAVSEATDPASRRDAILALQDFLAQKHIDMMQDEVDAAKVEIEAKKKHNDDLLAQQKKAENARYDQQKKDFDRNLAALQRYLNTHPKEWKRVQGEIMALLGKYGISYNTAGSALGADFVAGLRSQIGAASQAAKDLAAAGAGVPIAQLPATPPQTPSAGGHPAPTPTTGGGGGGGIHNPIPLAVGSWRIMKDNLLAYLHKDEMVLPRDVADLMRALGGGPSPFRTLAPAPEAPALRSPSVGRPDVSGGASASRGSGGTIIVKIGDQVVAEIVDRNLSVQDDIYGRPRVSTRSGR